VLNFFFFFKETCAELINMNPAVFTYGTSPEDIYRMIELRETWEIWGHERFWGPIKK